jgi:hypothetical protein
MVLLVIIIVIIIGTITLCGFWRALKTFSSYPSLVFYYTIK